MGGPQTLHRQKFLGLFLSALWPFPHSILPSFQVDGGDQISRDSAPAFLWLNFPMPRAHLTGTTLSPAHCISNHLGPIATKFASRGMKGLQTVGETHTHLDMNMICDRKCYCTQ
ncbi:UNVERIFIED_CONTAM: hypothetical protein K2H54_011780 [Gekko kuhli]